MVLLFQNNGNINSLELGIPSHRQVTNKRSEEIHILSYRVFLLDTLISLAIWNKFDHPRYFSLNLFASEKVPFILKSLFC